MLFTSATRSYLLSQHTFYRSSTPLKMSSPADNYPPRAVTQPGRGPEMSTMNTEPKGASTVTQTKPGRVRGGGCCECCAESFLCACVVVRTSIHAHSSVSLLTITIFWTPGLSRMFRNGRDVQRHLGLQLRWMKRTIAMTGCICVWK